MYGWLWRHLPGPVAVRALLALTAALVLVAVLFVWVFPEIAPLVPFNDNTVGQEAP